MKRYDVHMERVVLGTGVSYVKTVPHENPNGTYAMYNEANARIAELTAEVAAKAEDADRYRWLRDNCKPEYSRTETPHAVVKVCVGGVRNGTGWFDIIGPKAKVGVVTLDQAVDAARNALREVG